MNDFLAFNSLDTQAVYEILDRADQLHDHWHNNSMPKTLAGKRLALWFVGQGFRNRIAFKIGAEALGAQVSEIPGVLGVQEPLEDIGHYLNNWFDMAMIRCANHQDLLQLARDFDGPVINGKTNYNHPCEILGDLQYIRRKRSSLESLRVVFVGEVTNLCISWFEAAQVLPISVVQVAPEGYLMESQELGRWQANSQGSVSCSSDLEGTIDPTIDVIYTDCWPSSLDKASMEKVFGPYQVTEPHLSKMNPRGFFLPCPPVTRGEEVSTRAMGSELCKNYAAKEFLLHAQNALMEYLL